ncbi:MAG TPA: tetratricopeptide repeat protein [Planctomycetota bacterium]|nr:tetratricopeptide repeat protein [Planctomycetota bacterium]
MRIARVAPGVIALSLWLGSFAGALGAGRGESPADLQFDFAEGLFHDNLPRQAIGELQKFLKAHPNDPRASRAWFYLGECQYKEKRYEAALPAFETAAKDEKLTLRPVILYRIGDCRFRLNDLAGAVAPLRAFLAANLTAPDHRRFIVHARYALARAEFAQSHFAEALPLFEQVLADPSPENTYKAYVLLPIGDCLLGLGKTDDALGRYRELETFLEAALKAKPDGEDAKIQADLLARVRTQVAGLLLGQKKHEEALAVLGRVDAAGPLGAEVLYGRAQALFFLQRYQEALVPALDYLKRFPQGGFLSSTLYIAGESCYRTERFAEAEGHFAALLAADTAGKDPAREAAAFGRAAAAYRQGTPRAKEAAAAAQAFLKQFPQSQRAADVVYFQAEAAFWLGQHADALEQYKKVPAASAYTENVCHQTAVCLDLLKRYDEAAAAYEDYLKRYPKGGHGQAALDRAARLRGQLNHYAKAVELYGEFFQRYASADPKTAEDFLYRKGACEYELKQYDAMFATFSTYFDRYRAGGHKGDVLYFLAWYHSEIKQQYEAAVPLYELCGNIPGGYQKRALRLLAHTYVKLGKARLAAKQQPEANEQFLKAAETFLGLIRNSPDVLADAPEYLWTAEVFREQRRAAEAIEAFEALLKRFPDEGRPYVIYWLGELALNLPKPDHERAKRYFKDFVDRFPDHELRIWAKFGLAETLKGMGDSDGAWPYYQQVEELAPNAIGDAATRDGLMLKCQLQMGRMAFDKKNWEFAQKCLLRVAMLLATGEEAAEARYKAGIATFHLGDADATMAIWSRLVQLFPKSPWTEQLLKELDQYKLRLAPDGKGLEKRP